MPQHAREDVYMKAYGVLLTRVHLFSSTSTAFLRQLSVSAPLYQFSPGEFIMYSGDMSRDMYCIRNGYVEVLNIVLSSSLGLSILFY